jgi:hypothetical protein
MAGAASRESGCSRRRSIRVTSRYTALASIGEVLLVLWLAVKGVDEERWHEQAGSNLRAYGQSA